MTIRKITFAAVIAAVYAALTLAFQFMSFGPVQFRVAEVLCILPFFFPFSVWGLFVGCILANIIGPYGPLDVIFGSLTTLIAALCTMAIGRRSRGALASKVLAAAPPVVFNAVIIGAMIAYLESATIEAFWPAFISIGLSVGFGELVVMYALGLPALVLLPKMRFYSSLTAIYHQ